MTKSSAASALGRFGAKPPSSPTLVLWPALLSARLQRMENLRAHAQRLGECRRADRHHHEFLEVDRIVGMRAAIDDVHHRHRQHARGGAADIAIERQVVGDRRGFRDRKRHAEDRIGAEPRLVGRAVERDHGLVDLGLRFGVHAADGVENLAFDRSRPPSAHPCRDSGPCRRRAIRPPHARRSRRPTAPPRGRTIRPRA